LTAAGRIAILIAAMSDKTVEQLDAGSVMRLLDVTRKLAAPCDLDELLTLIIDVGREVLGADRGTVFLHDAGRRELFIKVATGVNEIRFNIDQGIAGQCARDQQIINVPDCYGDGRFNRDVDKQTGYRTRCLIAVPLVGLDDELVGVMQLLNPQKPHFDNLDERIAEALAGQAAVAIQRARLIEDRMEKLKLEADLDIARQIQMNVLPKTLPPCAGYELADFSEPADQTGGDIYDIVSLDSENDAAPMLILLADATGHGIGPALSVTQARAMLRMALRYSADLDKLVYHANAQLAQDLASNRFITAFVGMLDPQQHRILYHAPGQGPLLHFAMADRRCHWLNASTVPLGIVEDLDMKRPDPIDMAPGDMLVLLTDGFYEYQNEQDEQFGQDRVGEVILRHCDQPAAQIITHLVEQAKQFAGAAPQVDDLTALIVKRLA